MARQTVVRVLILTNLYPNPYQPNRAVFNRQQFRALAEQHAVRIIAPLSWVDELLSRAKGNLRLPRDRQRSSDGIPVEHPRYWYTPGAMRGWHGHFYRRSVQHAFQRALKEFCPDILLASWAYPDGWAAVKLARRAGLPVVIKVHGCDVLCAGRGLDQNPLRKRRTIEALCGADAIIAVSRHLAENVIDLGVDPERVKVVQNGVDCALFHPNSKAAARAKLGLDPAERILLFVGNLELVKGLDVLMEAFARLVQAGLRFRCLLIGQGSMRQQLERQSACLGLTETVRFIGPIPHVRLPEWYCAADLLVLPSRSEGVPNVLLEAAACRTPFVATRVGGIPEIAHLGASRLVPPGDPAALAQAIRDVLTVFADEPLHRSWGALRSHDETAAELVSVFSRVLRSRRRVRLAPVLLQSAR